MVHCAEFEVRNERQKHNVIAIFKFFLILSTVTNDVNATNAFEKKSITGDGSNHSRSRGGAPSCRRPTGVWGAKCWGDFPVFS